MERITPMFIHFNYLANHSHKILSAMKTLLKFGFITLCGVLLFAAFTPRENKQAPAKFIAISGSNLLTPDGQKFFIRGINLGNWLNPEGYMFGFKATSSARLIDMAFRELAGPDFTDQFWKKFKDNYVTREDIRFHQKHRGQFYPVALSL